MADKNDIDSLFWHLNAQRQYDKMQDMINAVKSSKTDDQARYVIRKGLAGVDNEGTSQTYPTDTLTNHYIQNWPAREEDISIPTTAAVLSSLDYKDKKDKDGNVTKTAQEQFIEDYLGKRKYITEKLAKKVPGFGTKSADILKQAFKESLYDEEARKSQSRRDSVLSGTAEDTPWYDWLAAKAMPLFASRELSAYKRGEDPSVGDYAADIGGNLLMMVPGTGYLKLASKAPMASKVLPVLSKVADKVPNGANIAKGIVGNSVAPVATEGLQFVGDAVDSERNAKYNTSAALMGALTNYGVNDVLLRKAGQLNKMLLDSQSGRTATKEAREALKGAASDDIKAKDVVQAYIVNKLGDGRAAEYSASRFGIDNKTLKDIRQNITDIDNERYIDAGMPTSMDSTDIKYLQEIAKNPDMVYDSEDTDFKMWFATRGNELLRGTKYHVPTLEVKF